MAQIDTLDLAVLILLLLGSVAYFTKGTYWAVPKDPYAAATAGSAQKKGTRNILEKMEESGKNCVVFYGSQTGTAEDYASRLAKEGSSRFGLKTMTADLEEYDYDNLDKFPDDKIAFFIVATYGEGEPTDNAVEFWEFINGESPSFSDDAEEQKPLQNLKYVTFGLGNNTYEHYNSMVRNLNKILTNLGAKRIGEAGEGDDGAGTMEEDYLAWKEPMWKALAEEMGLDEREAHYEPSLEVQEKEDLSKDDPTVYLGEPNRHHLEGNAKGPFTATNPYIAPIAESRELFTAKDRNCLHVEVDISDSNLHYTTGDHIAVWPQNPGVEVDRFMKTFGLDGKRDTVISVKGLDPTAKVPFPTPITYDAVFRHHMEICAPVSRQFMGILAEFSPTEEAKKEMKKIGADSDYFKEKISSKYYNIAQAVTSVHPGPWSDVPFTCLVESLNKIQVRYYSISSSSMVQPKKISITAVVESTRVPGAGHEVKGVTTNYLLGLKERQNGDSNVSKFCQSYDFDGPRGKWAGNRIPVHVRHSNFKLPSDPSKPIIMIGPGTGVAPFRAFIQERAEQVKKQDNLGETVLFYGCRRKDEDWLYKDEMEVSRSVLSYLFPICFFY